MLGNKSLFKHSILVHSRLYEKSNTQSMMNNASHMVTQCPMDKHLVCQGCILSPCLFNLYAEYIMRNAGLNEAQAGIKVSQKNISNLRYADTTLRAENEELKSLLMKVKEKSEKVGLKLSI